MKKWMVIIGATALTAVMVTSVMAYREVRGGYSSGTGYVADIAETQGLDLTTEQTAKINALREAHRKEIKPLLDEMTGKNRTLRDLWLARQPDQKRIEDLQEEAQKLRLRLTDRIDAYLREVYRELTPNQRARVRIIVPSQGTGFMDGNSRRKGRMPDRWMGIKVR